MEMRGINNENITDDNRKYLLKTNIFSFLNKNQ